AVYAVLVPEGRGPAPKELAVADGPYVRLTNSQKHKTPTYASLLESPFQKSQLEYYGTGQLARIALAGGAKNVGAPAMIDSIDVSPDGKFLRVSTMQKPFSYLVPVASFGTVELLWTADGKLVTT